MSEEHHGHRFSRFNSTALVLIATFLFCISNFSGSFYSSNLIVVNQPLVTNQVPQLSQNHLDGGGGGARDCSINWLRIPKTATDMVHRTFMSPLLTPKLFRTTYLESNSCVVGPGDCTAYWGVNEKYLRARPFRFDPTRDSNVPPNYGFHPDIAVQGVDVTGESIPTTLGRCFHKPGVPLHCVEYDANKRTMDFGPPSKIFWVTKRAINVTQKENEGNATISRVLSGDKRPFYISPVISGHVGLDVSLYGWLLPPNPMVFSIFRDPVKRLISSFHYGIKYGADQPGHVTQCSLEKSWRENVVTETRKTYSMTKNSSSYQTLLRRYLSDCRSATNNVYTQFLDPLNKDVNVAIQNLEKHVTVGLQDDVLGAMKRWYNVALNACEGHPSYALLNETLAKSLSINGVRRPSSTSSLKEIDSVVLSDPEIAELDEDLQILIANYTREDQVIYKRVLELYQEQSEFN